VNSTVGPSFNENFTEKSTYESHKQCIRPTNFDVNAVESEFQRYPNSGFTIS